MITKARYVCMLSYIQEKQQQKVRYIQLLYGTEYVRISYICIYIYKRWTLLLSDMQYCWLFMPFTYFAQAAHSQYSYSHSQNSHTWRNIQYYCTLFNVYIVSVWVCVRVRIGLLVLCMCCVCYVCSPKPKRYSILYVYKLVFSSSVFQSAFLSF